MGGWLWFICTQWTEAAGRDVWGKCMCAFSTFLHCLVQLGTVFCICLVFLSEKIAHKQMQNPCYAQIVPYQLCWNKFAFWKQAYLAEPTKPSGTPSTLPRVQHLHQGVSSFCICCSLCLDCSFPLSSHEWLHFILQASVSMPPPHWALHWDYAP